VTSTAVAVAPLHDVGLWARTNLLESLLIIAGAVLLARFAGAVGRAITRQIDARSQLADSLVRSEATKHRHAMSEVLTWGVRAVVYGIAAVTVLGRLGLPLSGIVAPAAVAGVALGFGAQRIVQDILAGFFLITERQYGFGDLIQLSVTGVTLTRTGTVEDVTLRITSIRTTDGSVVITPNGQIVQVTNLSRDWARAVVDVPVPIGSDVNLANEILRRVGAEMFADSGLSPSSWPRRASWAERPSTSDRSTSASSSALCPAGSSTSVGFCGNASVSPSPRRVSPAAGKLPSSRRTCRARDPPIASSRELPTAANHRGLGGSLPRTAHAVLARPTCAGSARGTPLRRDPDCVPVLGAHVRRSAVRHSDSAEPRARVKAGDIGRDRHSDDASRHDSHEADNECDAVRLDDPRRHQQPAGSDHGPGGPGAVIADREPPAGQRPTAGTLCPIRLSAPSARCFMRRTAQQISTAASRPSMSFQGPLLRTSSALNKELNASAIALS
jgi:hypothetical protein